eukprot:1157687-Pelagomonas_calceolata.AAC.7
MLAHLSGLDTGDPVHAYSPRHCKPKQDQHSSILLAHSQGLTVVTQFMRTALATASQADSGIPQNERTLALDTATHVLEALTAPLQFVVPPHYATSFPSLLCKQAFVPVLVETYPAPPQCSAPPHCITSCSSLLCKQASVPALLEACAASSTPSSAAVMDGLDALLQILLAVPGFTEPPLAEVVRCGRV